MKGQKKKYSLVESMLNTAIGYFVGLATQMIVFPMFDIKVTISEQFLIGAIFTVVSIVRGYFVRRLFNWIHVKQCKE